MVCAWRDGFAVELDEPEEGQYGIRVDDADSAGLALLLEWKARAQRVAGDIRFVGVPESLIAIAQTTEVSDLIR